MNIEQKIKVTLLKEKLEKLVDKKVILEDSHDECGCGCNSCGTELQEGVLKEGTWALPEGEKFKDGERILKQLNKILRNAYNIFGDDEFMDGVQNAITRANYLLDLERRKNLKSSVVAPKQEVVEQPIIQTEVKEEVPVRKPTMPLTSKILKLAKGIENTSTVARLVQKNLGVSLPMDRAFFSDLEGELQRATPQVLQTLYTSLIRAFFGADASSKDIEAYFNESVSYFNKSTKNLLKEEASPIVSILQFEDFPASRIQEAFATKNWNELQGELEEDKSNGTNIDPLTVVNDIKKNVFVETIDESDLVSEEEEDNGEEIEVETAFPIQELKSKNSILYKKLGSKFKYWALYPVNYNRGTSYINIGFSNNPKYLEKLVGDY